MITNDNKGNYLVKKGQKNDNVIYERPLIIKNPQFYFDLAEILAILPNHG